MRSATAKPAAFEATDRKLVTVVGAPSYTSGTHAWKGAIDILKPSPAATSTKPKTSASSVPPAFEETKVAIPSSDVVPERPNRNAKPYSSTAAATAPASRYFRPASDERSSRATPASTNCETEVVSRKTKMAIRSCACARSTIEPAAVSSSAKNSGRGSARESPSAVTITTAAVTPMSRNVKNSANSSTTTAPEMAGPLVPARTCQIAHANPTRSEMSVSVRTGARPGRTRSAPMTTPAPSSSANAGPMWWI